MKLQILVQSIRDSEQEVMQYILMNNRRKAFHSIIPSENRYETGFTRIPWKFEKLKCPFVSKLLGSKVIIKHT